MQQFKAGIISADELAAAIDAIPDEKIINIRTNYTSSGGGGGIGGDRGPNGALYTQTNRDGSRQSGRAAPGPRWRSDIAQDPISQVYTDAEGNPFAFNTTGGGSDQFNISEVGRLEEALAWLAAQVTETTDATDEATEATAANTEATESNADAAEESTDATEGNTDARIDATDTADDMADAEDHLTKSLRTSTVAAETAAEAAERLAMERKDAALDTLNEFIENEEEEAQQRRLDQFAQHAAFLAKLQGDGDDERYGEALASFKAFVVSEGITEQDEVDQYIDHYKALAATAGIGVGNILSVLAEIPAVVRTDHIIATRKADDERFRGQSQAAQIQETIRARIKRLRNKNNPTQSDYDAITALKELADREEVELCARWYYPK